MVYGNRRLYVLTGALDSKQKSKGKKLEKWEQEFYDQNRKTVDIQVRLTEEEKEEERRLNELLR